MQKLDEKKHTIISILDRLQAYNPEIGDYVASIMDSGFNYSVKLTNGRIVISETLVHDYERARSYIAEDQFKSAAERFIPSSQIFAPSSPAPTSITPILGTDCHWCNKPMDKGAIRCASCGKLRKDIYEDKIKCYSLGMLGALPFGIGFGFYIADGSNEIASDSLKLWLTIIGSLLILTSLFYYIRTSEKIKSYWWH